MVDPSRFRKSVGSGKCEMQGLCLASMVGGQRGETEKTAESKLPSVLWQIDSVFGLTPDMVDISERQKDG